MNRLNTAVFAYSMTITIGRRTARSKTVMHYVACGDI